MTKKDLKTEVFLEEDSFRNLALFLKIPPKKRHFETMTF